MSFLKKPGYLIILTFAILPMLYLIFFIEGAVSFSGFSSSMRSIGKLLGLTGIILFSITLFLNTRLKITEKLFQGLDKSYKAHHALGITAFILLLFHPLFLASQFLAISAAAAAKFLLPFNDASITLGIFALVSMEVFLILTIFARLKYQTWKFIHRFLGLSFILASLHVILIPSDVSRDILLKIYITLFIIIGIASFIYRTIFWKALVKRYTYRIDSIKHADDITEIKISPVEDSINFTPGQFVFLSFDSDSISKEPHPFTISSSSSKKELVFSIKSLGDFTTKLKELKPGAKVRLEGPYGKFSFANHPSKNYVFIAGGIGITPFLSMLRSISDSPDSFDFSSIDLYYSIKSEKKDPFLAELNKIANSIKNKKIRVFPFITENRGHLSSEYISSNTEFLKDSKIFICGPPPMMYSLKEQFISSQIRKNDIYLEEFGL